MWQQAYACGDDQVLRYSQLIWMALCWLLILPCNILLVKVMLLPSCLGCVGLFLRDIIHWDLQFNKWTLFSGCLLVLLCLQMVYLLSFRCCFLVEIMTVMLLFFCLIHFITFSCLFFLFSTLCVCVCLLELGVDFTCCHQNIMKNFLYFMTDLCFVRLLGLLTMVTRCSQPIQMTFCWWLILMWRFCLLLQ